MRLEGLIVGVDLDGVCADFYGRMREIAAEWFECAALDLTENVSYGLSEWGVDPAKYDSLHRLESMAPKPPPVAADQRGNLQPLEIIQGRP